MKITDDSWLMEILFAWEEGRGPALDFYRAIDVSSNGMASIIGKAKKLKREGFPTVHHPALTGWLDDVRFVTSFSGTKKFFS